MNELYAHKITFVPKTRDKLGAQLVCVVVYSPDEVLDYLDVMQEIDTVFNSDCNILHERVKGVQGD